MLDEAGVIGESSTTAERPLKRRRPAGENRDSEIPRSGGASAAQGTAPDAGSSDDDDIEFEDVALPEPRIQTAERDDSDDDEDVQFEDVDFTAPLQEAESSETPLELNLSTQQQSTAKRAAERRKPITKEERGRRVDIHRVHLLCLLSHVSRRNHWCNDLQVQELLRPHLSAKTIKYLTPGSHLPQFGQAESLKNGLKQAQDMWSSKFEIRERGLRRALWAEDAQQLRDYESPADMDSCLDKSDFREASKRLQGSRDVGAQLYCALLRSVGVRARLVCSLQPLSFLSGGPALPKTRWAPKATHKAAQAKKTMEALAKYEEMAAKAGESRLGTPPSARRRLGHPNAAAYDFVPYLTVPEARRTYDAPIRIRESAYPVYWVEILDTGHQKWQPVDPVVTKSFWKPRAFEPPITDKENCMSYVVAFDEDGAAKDVTRRYAKAYTAKTRRLRVETPLEDGGRWWQRATKPLRRRSASDLDQIEDIELAGVEAREPMPRNVQDFKDHPVFALERHMRRHEVLVPEATPSGTVAAGSRGPLEKIYRRRDVRIARSVDKWFRLGREVKPNEIPAKWLQKKAKPKRSRFGDMDDTDDEDDAGMPIYTMEQTELYEPAPVRNGRVPKNKFGNVEVYVESMIPKGAVHVVHELAARAAYIIGVDYAPALTGFQFKGRQGTAVLTGIVVAEEFQDAIYAAIEGMEDVQQELEDERRAAVALRMWRRFIMGLRIRERIWSGVNEDERREADREAELQAQLDGAESDATEEFDMVIDDEDEGGGGFLIE